MESIAAAEATAPAVSKLTSLFMLDGQTYKRGAELGFTGLDFYVTGRGGVLGQVDAGVVAAAFAFLEPAHVRAQWEAGLAVMSASEAAAAFAACGYAWAEAHVPDDVDAARLAELAAAVGGGARLACAPIFAGWRQLPLPESPKATAIHHMNALRELRHGLHAACVIAAGIAPLEALSLDSPGMHTIFGWDELVDAEHIEPRWNAAEAATNVAIAHAYDALTEAERGEFAELSAAVYAAVSG